MCICGYEIIGDENKYGECPSSLLPLDRMTAEPAPTTDEMKYRNVTGLIDWKLTRDPNILDKSMLVC